MSIAQTNIIELGAPELPVGWYYSVNHYYGSLGIWWLSVRIMRERRFLPDKEEARERRTWPYHSDGEVSSVEAQQAVVSTAMDAAKTIWRKTEAARLTQDMRQYVGEHS